MVSLVNKLRLLKVPDKEVDRFVPPVTKGAPTQSDIARYRYLSGPNLGGLFVNERWIDDTLYKENSEGSSELSALESWTSGSTPTTEELAAMKTKWENHWDTFITEKDWEYMKSKDVTSIRLPIGFWCLPDPGRFSKTTPFEPYVSVYENCWTYVEKIIDAAMRYEITVVLDLHVLQAGALLEKSAGIEIDEGHLIRRKKLKDLSVETAVAAAECAVKKPNVIALQLLNEASFAQVGLNEFYRECLIKIGKILTNEYLQIVISDAWDPNKWGEYDNLILDSHIYRAATSRYKQMSAKEHIKYALSCVKPVKNTDVIVGEWAPVLEGDSANDDVLALQVEYGKNLVECFSRLAGNFFWTFKFKGDGGAWDFRKMADKGVYVKSLDPSKVPESAKDEAYATAKTTYQTKRQRFHKDAVFNEESFHAGFDQGWEDSIAFAKFNGSRIGRLNTWSVLRYLQHTDDRTSPLEESDYFDGLSSASRAYTEAASN
ncbi:17-beta-hydroxysteroid dehydrogenase-like protein [Starmerella bacillaris]|uniref:17-beta-hydroxysteroid dehydrogenase-like protein n=1 Tax=Starmerella bacillaris TaxID=1247836 RepID=A0AAV5RKI1_STABA|nr:17-beta-hydroxysteroid dehydrogenase-like protein [Starmerella bacillaris]